MTDLVLNAGHDCFVFLFAHFAIALSILYAEGCRFAHATRHIHSHEVIDTQHNLSLMLQSLHRHCLRLRLPHHCCPVIPCLHLHY